MVTVAIGGRESRSARSCCRDAVTGTGGIHPCARHSRQRDRRCGGCWRFTSWCLTAPSAPRHRLRARAPIRHPHSARSAGHHRHADRRQRVGRPRPGGAGRRPRHDRRARAALQSNRSARLRRRGTPLDRRRPRRQRRGDEPRAARSEDVRDVAGLRRVAAAGADRGLAAPADRRHSSDDRCARRSQDSGRQLRPRRRSDAFARHDSADGAADAGELQ